MYLPYSILIAGKYDLRKEGGFAVYGRATTIALGPKKCRSRVRKVSKRVPKMCRKCVETRQNLSKSVIIPNMTTLSLRCVHAISYMENIIKILFK